MTTLTTGRATDFITFSRTSNATVTGADGRIRWAGHNLLTHSESFDNAAWTAGGTNSIITANSTAAPNGTTTADAFMGDGAATPHYIVQNVTLSSSDVYRVSVYVKSNGLNFVQFFLGGGLGYANFNITSGSHGAGNSVAPFGSLSVQDVGSGWYLCSATLTNPANSGLYIGLCNSATAARAVSFATSSGVYLWGAHLYRSDLGGMVLNPARGDAYYPTTPRNLLGFTEDFNSWTKNAATVTTNSAIAPNGLQTADLIVNTTDNSAHGVYQTISFSTACTMSVYAKAGASNFVGLTNTSSTTPAAYSGAVFNLASGTVTLSNNCTATITAVGDGWYRCAITALTVAGSFFVVSVAQNGTNAPWVLYTGSGQSIYLWGAQLSDSASLDAYSPVYGAAVTSAAYYAPRLDYDPVTLAARGLLVEEQRTNLVLHTAAFDNAYWGKTNLNTSGTPSWVDVGLAPDGTTTAEKLIPNTTTGFHFAASDFVTGTGSHTMSVFAKGGEYTRFALREMAVVGSGALFDLTAGTVLFTSAGVTATITPVGNNWYRCTASLTWGTSYKMGVVVATNTTTADLLPSFAGNGTDGLFVWGAQLEANATFATSYIPTGASTATRTADVASVSTQAFPYSASASSIVTAFDLLGAGPGAFVLTLQASAAADGLAFYKGSTTTGIASYVDAATVFLGNVPVNTVAKAGLAYNGSSNGTVLNGGTVSAIGTTVSAPANKLSIGSNFSNAFNLNGHIRQITYIPRRLSNAELQARTV